MERPETYNQSRGQKRTTQKTQVTDAKGVTFDKLVAVHEGSRLTRASAKSTLLKEGTPDSLLSRDLTPGRIRQKGGRISRSQSQSHRIIDEITVETPSPKSRSLELEIIEPQAQQIEKSANQSASTRITEAEAQHAQSPKNANQINSRKNDESTTAQNQGTRNESAIAQNQSGQSESASVQNQSTKNESANAKKRNEANSGPTNPGETTPVTQQVNENSAEKQLSQTDDFSATQINETHSASNIRSAAEIETAALREALRLSIESQVEEVQKERCLVEIEDLEERNNRLIEIITPSPERELQYLPFDRRSPLYAKTIRKRLLPKRPILNEVVIPISSPEGEYATPVGRDHLPKTRRKSTDLRRQILLPMAAAHEDNQDLRDEVRKARKRAEEAQRVAEQSLQRMNNMEQMLKTLLENQTQQANNVPQLGNVLPNTGARSRENQQNQRNQRGNDNDEFEAERNDRTERAGRHPGDPPSSDPSDDEDDRNGPPRRRVAERRHSMNRHGERIQPQRYEYEPMLEELIDRRRKEMIDRMVKNTKTLTSSSATEISIFLKQMAVNMTNIKSAEEDEYFTREVKVKVSAATFIPANELAEAMRWCEVKKLLETEFRATNSKTALESKLDALNQNPTESIEEFGKRARNLLHDYETFYGAAMTHELRERIEEQIHKQFVANVRNTKVREALRYRGADAGLASAISYAVEQETLQKPENVDYETICGYCDYRGHKSERCQTKDRHIQMSNSRAGNQTTKTCGKCGYNGHSALHCVLKIPSANNNAQVNNANSSRKSFKSNQRGPYQSNSNNNSNDNRRTNNEFGYKGRNYDPNYESKKRDNNNGKYDNRNDNRRNSNYNSNRNFNRSNYGNNNGNKSGNNDKNQSSGNNNNNNGNGGNKSNNHNSNNQNQNNNNKTNYAVSRIDSYQSEN